MVLFGLGLPNVVGGDMRSYAKFSALVVEKDATIPAAQKVAAATKALSDHFARIAWLAMTQAVGRIARAGDKQDCFIVPCGAVFAKKNNEWRALPRAVEASLLLIPPPAPAGALHALVQPLRAWLSRPGSRSDMTSFDAVMPLLLAEDARRAAL